MAFNFGGMMRGLGAGLTQTGAWMKEQEKLDWETQQATLRYEREMHMEKLRMQNQKEMQKEGFTHAETLQKGSLGHAETMTKMQIGAADKNAERQYNLSLQESQANAAARSSAAANDAARLKIAQDEAAMRVEAYNNSKPEAQIAMREKQRSALIDSGIPKQYVEVYVQTGNLSIPKKDGNDISVNGENILKAKEMGTSAYDLMDESEQTNFNTSNGIKGNDKAAGRKAMGDMAVSDLLYTATGAGSAPTGGGVLQGGPKPAGKINLKEEIAKAKAGDAEAEGRLQALQKQNPTDSLVIDANREVAASKQSKPKEVASRSEATPVRSVASTRKEITAGSRITKLDKLSMTNHGKPFNQLSSKQQKQINAMVD